MTFNVRRSTSNTFFVRYYNNVPYIYYGDFPVAPVPDLCYPIPYYTSWTDPNTVCDTKTFLSQGEMTYYKWPQSNTPPESALDSLCPSPPYLNISNKIKITIPKDPVFSGVYVFDRLLTTSPWVFNSGQSVTSLQPYTDSSSTLNGSYLVKLDYIKQEPFNTPRYKGYFEWQTIDNTAISGYAFPCYFIFTAVKPPSGVVDGLINTFGAPNPSFPGSLPAITGRECHRLAVGIKLPTRYRHPNGDWILVDQISHIISGTTNYISGIDSQPSTFNINLIDNNPYNAEYSYATSTCTGINENGFAFRVTATGLGFDGYSTYPSSPTYFLGNYQKHEAYNYNWYDSNNGNAARTTVVDQTKFSGPKIPTEALVTFVNSCRNPNFSTPCVETIVPTSVIPTIRNTGCLGSTINIDYWCVENKTTPDLKDFIDNGITGIIPIYSGITNIYPLTRLSDSTSNFYDTTNNIISLPYTGSYDPNIFRKWINEEIKFISLSGNQIYQTYNNIDIYWKTDEQNQNNIYAKLYPDDSDQETPSVPCVYMQFAESSLNGYYKFNTSSGYWVSVSDSNIQIRFINPYWYVGIVVTGTYTIYYRLNNYPNLDRGRLSSEIVYYGNFGNTNTYLTLNQDAHSSCNNTSPPEIAAVSPYSLDIDKFMLLRFWRNLYSLECRSDTPTSVITQTISINCVSGSILVDGQLVPSGQSRTYNSIPFLNQQDEVLNSTITSSITILGIQPSIVTATATLDWDTGRDHDLYGQFMFDASNVIYTQNPRSIPIGVWINSGSYLGTKTSPLPTTILGQC